MTEINESPASPGSPLQPAVRWAELCCARLCHDVASPLGSLAGAVELAGDDPDSAAEALSVAKDSLAALSGRVRLLRTAWGTEDGPLSRVALVALAMGYPTRRVSLDLEGLADTIYPGPVARLLLNLLLLGIEALPMGGILTATGTLESGIMLLPRGPRAAWPAGFAVLLQHGPALPGSPRELQAPLTVLLAAEAGVRLSLLMASTADGQPAPLLAAMPKPTPA